MSEVLLPESHPKTSTFNRRIIFNQRFQLLVINQIGFFGAYIRISERTMNLVRLCLDPFSVLVILTFLGYFPDIDFGIEIGSECHTMITGIAIDNIEILHLFEIMFRRIGRINPAHTRIESATENSRQPGLLKTFPISPLPFIFVFSFVERLIVGGIEIIDTAMQTGIHNRQVLIRQSHIDNDIGLMLFEQCH